MKTITTLQRRLVRCSLCCLIAFSSIISATARDLQISAVCPTGQTLYYILENYPNSNHATLTCGNSISHPWYSVPMPVGDIVLPSEVTYQGVTYPVTAIGPRALVGCEELTGDLIIPNTVTSIGYQAFADCFGFTGNLIIPNSVVTIGADAFHQCNFTGDLVIPNSVTRISARAFWACDNFEGTLTLGNSLQYIYENAFEGCSGFTGELTIPNTVTYIGNFAFKDCSGFTGDIVLPNQLVNIRPSTFEGCTGFNGNLIIPSSIRNIYDYAFSGCCGLSAIYVLPETPPTVYPWNPGDTPAVFDSINPSIPVYVPICYIENYPNATGWNTFNNYQSMNIFGGDEDTNWSNTANWICPSLPTNNDHVLITSNCEINGAANASSLILFNRRTLNIKPSGVLTVEGNIVNKGSYANLIIEDGGQLLNHCTDVEASFTKNISPYTDNNNGWYLITYPFEGSCLVSSVGNMLNNQYDLYYYDEPTFYWMNYEFNNNNFTHLESGKGYLYANSEETHLSFTGTLKDGFANVSIPLSYSPDIIILSGFNLVGNPFVHNVTSVSFRNAMNECYRMNYAHDDLIIGTISDNDPLKPGEGFFAVATGDDATVSFNSRTNTGISRSKSVSLEIYQNQRTTSPFVTSQKQQTIDRLIIKKGDNKHIEKVSLSNKGAHIYAKNNDQDFALVSCKENEQAVHFKTPKSGTYTIVAKFDESEFDYLHLIDYMTGADIDLMINPTYTFNAEDNDPSARFNLLFAPKDNDEQADRSFANEEEINRTFTYSNDGTLHVTNDDRATLQVIDVTGRIILYSETIFGNVDRSLNLSTGIYVLRLINDKETRSQKIVIE